MALYKYKGFSSEGKSVSGTFDAPSSADVRNTLSQKGIYASSVELAQDASGASFKEFLFARPVTLKDKLFFTKQLGVLLNAGVPLVKALELLIEQTEGSLRSIVITLRDQIKEGSSLANALALYPKIFEKVYVQLVRAGEASGNLEGILNRLYEYIERQAELRKKIRSAVMGPLIQLALIFLVAGTLTVFVMPQMVSTLSQVDAGLPLPTKIMVVLSDILKNYYMWLFFGIIGLALIFLYWKSTPSGARMLDKIKLRLPVIKYFARMGTVVQFSRTLGMLVEGGVNLAEALTIVTNLVDNKILADAIEKAKEQIIKQGKISEFLAQTGIFPPLAIYLINTGEQSGQLGQMLLTVADQYENDLLEFSDNLTAKLQPLMLLIMALVVGFIVLAIFMPLQEITKKLTF